MIQTELYMIRSDGVRLIRTYSDIGHKIERDGDVYEEAVDPEEMGRVYTETDEMIPGWEPPVEEENEESAEETVEEPQQERHKNLWED